MFGKKTKKEDDIVVPTVEKGGTKSKIEMLEAEIKELQSKETENVSLDKKKEELKWFVDTYDNIFAANASTESIKINLLYGILIELKKLNE